MPARVKIGIAGPHSTGKTTTVEWVAERLQAAGWRTERVGDVAHLCPLPVLHRHTAQSTLWIVSTTVANEIAAARDSDVVLVDRAVFDAIAYYNAALAHRREAPDAAAAAHQALMGLVSVWSESYDWTFRTRIDPALPILDDGVRDTDPHFRSGVATALDHAVTRFRPDTVELPYAPSDSAELITELVLRRLKGDP